MTHPARNGECRERERGANVKISPPAKSSRLFALEWCRVRRVFRIDKCSIARFSRAIYHADDPARVKWFGGDLMLFQASYARCVVSFFARVVGSIYLVFSREFSHALFYWPRWPLGNRSKSVERISFYFVKTNARTECPPWKRRYSVLKILACQG